MVFPFTRERGNDSLIENDTKGRYRRGDVGFTIGIVTDDEKVPVNINNVIILIPIKHLRLIIDDRQR